jgi:hypothetical protein
MLMLILGLLLIGGAAILDSIFRLRMFRIGRKTALFDGGAFNYSNYRQARAAQGWSAWPVYLLWALLICGMALSIAGFFVQFGTHPLRQTRRNWDRRVAVANVLWHFSSPHGLRYTLSSAHRA